MTTATMEVLQDKTFKEGVYSASQQLMDLSLKKGRSLMIFDSQGKGTLTSAVQDWVFFANGTSLIITLNSVYVVKFQ